MVNLTEAILNAQQRRQRGLVMRRYHAKIEMARERLSHRAASGERLTARARHHAIQLVRNRVAGERGRNYANLSASEKMMIDKRVQRSKGVIARIALRLIPSLRKADLEKFSHKPSVNEDVNALFEAAFELGAEDSSLSKDPKKRFHQLIGKDGKVKLDGRFKIWRKKTQIKQQYLDTGIDESIIHDLVDMVYEENSNSDHLDKHIIAFSKVVKSTPAKHVTYRSDGKKIPNMKYVETSDNHQKIFDHLKSIGYTKTKGYDSNPTTFTGRTNQDSMTYNSDPVHHKSGVSAYIEQEHGGKTQVYFKHNKMNEEKVLDENIKGWKHAGSDLNKWRAAKGKDVKLVSLKKNGEENKMSTASKMFRSEDEAHEHHTRVRGLNPNSNIRHNMYVDGKLVKTLDESVEKKVLEDGTDEQVKAFKKMTPGEASDINEAFEELFS